MKITRLQKKIVLSVFGVVLSERAIRYTYLKHIKEIVVNGNYFDWTSLLNIFIFVIGIVIFAASIVGILSIIRDVFRAKKEEIVSERFIRFFIKSFWTIVVSIILALIIKTVIWP